MKLTNHSLLLLATAILMTSCQPSQPPKAQEYDTDSMAISPVAQLTADTGYSLPIPIDTANRMINSYLTGVNYPSNVNFLRSVLINADTLRSYLADDHISNMRLMLAHNQSWMNSGKYGVNGSTKAAALTFILVGLDAQGRYIYNRNNMVYEHMQPCPYHCPENTPNTLTPVE